MSMISQPNRNRKQSISQLLPARRTIMTSELEISPADTRKAPGKEQQAAGVGILLQIMMLVLSFVLGHVLRRKKVYIIPEASASLLIGILPFPL